MMNIQARSRVEELQSVLLTMPQVELPTRHLFADGLYARIVERPAGALIVGKVHRRSHFYIVLKGRVQVGRQIYEAGSVVVSEPGTKRAVYALEDSVCMTVHHTNKKNLRKIERELVQPDDKAAFDCENRLKLPAIGETR